MSLSYLNNGFPSLSLYHKTRLTLSSGCDGVMLHGRFVNIPDTDDTLVTGTVKENGIW